MKTVKMNQVIILAMCMMAGINLMAADHTITLINNWKNPISVSLQAKHKKKGKTRHENTTLLIPSGTTGNTASWGYNGKLQWAKFTDTVTNKLVEPGPLNGSSQTVTIHKSGEIKSNRANFGGMMNQRSIA